MSAPHVVVVGGGLAGLSAAVALTDAGVRVSLFEARPRLGGATWSFERNGLTFDNGQHVYLRCCTAYRRFLERLGTEGDAPLQDHLALPVVAPADASGTPRVAWIERSGLPAPLHLLGSLLAYRHLPLADRIRLGRALLALSRLRLGDPILDTETLGAFLARHGQRSRAVEALFELIALPTTNVSAAEGSLALGAKVFKTGLLDAADAADIGWARVPLRALHVDPAHALLERAGAQVARREKVEAIELDADRRAATGVVVGRERVEADGVVLAVPHDDAAVLLPRGGRIDPSRLHGLGRSPIVDVHLVYDRTVMGYDLIAAVDSPIQFCFDRTAAAGMASGEGQCLAVSISGADAEQGERPEVLIDRYSKAVGDLFPSARGARLVDAVVSRELDATFRGVPGTAALRCGPETGFANLVLAGAWTATGWPATMEGAVRSGTAAAARVLGTLRPGSRVEHAEGVPA